MEHPPIEDLYKAISTWLKENFKEAILKYHKNKDDFKFGRITRITKLWKEGDYWTVEAPFEYVLGDLKWMVTTFQVNKEGKIVGYGLTKPEF